MPDTSGFQVISDTLRENRLAAEQAERVPPKSCPNDGEPLQWHPTKHIWFCRFDGWIWRN